MLLVRPSLDQLSRSWDDHQVLEESSSLMLQVMQVGLMLSLVLQQLVLPDELRIIFQNLELVETDSILVKLSTLVHELV